MQQTILPQSPASAGPQEAGGAKSSNRKDVESGENRFDELSRAERKRLENRRAEDRDQAEALSDRKAADKAEEKSDRVAREASAANGKPKPVAGKEESSSSAPTGRQGGAVEESVSEVDEALQPLTFASLQSLLNGGAEHRSLSPVFSQVPPGMNSGLPGQAQGNGAMSQVPGISLAELLVGSSATETTRPVDPASLLATPRFQAMMETATQQAAQPGKLAAEAALPLRGYATSVDVPVGQAEWGDKVMGKLSWLTARNMSVAEIHLTPPDMGPMEVKVRVQNDQASVTVHAANPVVREQLELHSHRLRDLLGEQGLSLGQFDVSDQAGQQSGGESGEAGEGDGRSSHSPAMASQDLDGDLGTTGQLDLGWQGEVDIFA
ncbi:flagellar hook-length control protein FliK [Marinobacter daepoensis]|uniref:Flagellar hook-length control protein FliK n=1 Tax=Marinobacter daepoensis TaxID=262077 RepID=A0ABS3BFG0_9GAMM|nr:flagellar hook-length control protein FliK [Marinobacter daepoensis]MBN7769611.1 flagellar hook-length control protein FliK [Marinobacter daepoensis]MBY6078301.1 flagellar hook-length control protein FliK [Marinobacter daepoensis]